MPRDRQETDNKCYWMPKGIINIYIRTEKKCTRTNGTVDYSVATYVLLSNVGVHVIVDQFYSMSIPDSIQSDNTIL